MIHKLKKIINIIVKRLFPWKCDGCDTLNSGSSGFCVFCKKQRGFTFWR